MKKLLLILLVAFGFLGSGSQAQSLYSGLGGTAFTAFDFGTELGFRALVGLDDIGGRGSGFGARATLDFYLNSLAFAVGADVYSKMPVGGIDFTAGGGVRVLSVGNVAFLLQGLLGAEFLISRSFVTFVEVQPGWLIVPATGSAFFLGINAGVKMSF